MTDGTSLIISTGNLDLDNCLTALPLGLKQHIIRARSKAIELAEIHSLDSEKAGFAALFHDIVRHVNVDDLYKQAINYGLKIHPVEKLHGILLHGPVGAELLREKFKIRDPEILEAVRWHSTFNRGLGSTAKLAFLADKLDPNKASRFSDLEGKCLLAKTDLDGAILSFLEEDITAMLSSGHLIHPATIEARTWLIETRVEPARDSV
jgi:predicted HD superfamily hydrolase involved in NAD metabolism